MTEAGKMVRNAGSQLTGAFKGLWGKQGKAGGAEREQKQGSAEPGTLPEATRVAQPAQPQASEPADAANT
jgi:hypothetical protein